MQCESTDRPTVTELCAPNTMSGSSDFASRRMNGAQKWQQSDVTAAQAKSRSVLLHAYSSQTRPSITVVVVVGLTDLASSRVQPTDDEVKLRPTLSRAD